MPRYHLCTDPNGMLCKIDTPFNITHFAIKSACSFWQDCFMSYFSLSLFSFNTLLSSEIYHITILKDLLIKYWPTKFLWNAHNCNITHFATKLACSFWQDFLISYFSIYFFSFNTLSSFEIYHIAILRDFLIHIISTI